MADIDFPIDKIEWQKSGAGSPVLLLHGWGGDVNTMNVIGEKLKTHHTIYSISLPGFGKSPEPSPDFGSNQYAQVVTYWIENQVDTSFSIIGHSHGGRVAICLTADNPSLVNKLILIGSAGIPPKESITRRYNIWKYKSLRKLQSVLPAAISDSLSQRLEMMGSEDWKSASPSMRRILSRIIREDLSDKMSKIQSDTLLIWGREDTATPLWMGETMQTLIPGSKLEVVRGAGHYCYVDQPGEVNSQIWNFLGLPSAW